MQFQIASGGGRSRSTLPSRLVSSEVTVTGVRNFYRANGGFVESFFLFCPAHWKLPNPRLLNV